MMITKVPIMDKDGKQREGEDGYAKFFVNQFSLKLAHQKFLEATGLKAIDSAMFGPVYVLGEQDGIKIRTLADNDENKLNMQESVYVTANIDASMGWWKQAGKVLGKKLVEVNIEKLASRPLTVDDFIFDDATMKESDQIRKSIGLVNQYIEDYQAETGPEEKKTDLALIKVLLPAQYEKQEKVNLNYRQIAELAKYGKNKKSLEWQQFMDFVKGLDNYNELLATKNEQQKTKMEIQTEEEVDALIKKIEERKKSEAQRKIRKMENKLARQEKRAELKHKIAVWELKAIFDIYFAGVAVKDAVKKGAKKIYNGSKVVATKVKDAFTTKNKEQTKDEMSM